MKTIITIGRQFGSAGREIGEKLAEYFGIKCYDKELLSRAAKESGFCEEMIQNHDERPTNSFLYNLVMDTYSFGYNASSFVDMPISHKVFLAQFAPISARVITIIIPPKNGAARTVMICVSTAVCWAWKER